MKTLLKTKTNTVVSILGLKLWIAKTKNSNWHFDLSRSTIGFFKYGVRYNQKAINTGLENGFID